MKRIVFALAAALIAAGASVPALAASSIEVPTVPAPTVDPRADNAAFDPAAIAQLSWDGTKQSPADQQTMARVATDGKFLYVRFDATQKERISSITPVDGKSGGDLVWIDLQPSGATSPVYHFVANPDGSGYANSSAGSTPRFESAGTSFDGGYTVTMKIPLAQLHAVQAGGPWTVQFGRTVAASGSQLVWSHEGNVAQAGTMSLPASIGVTSP
jgi:hypothetical protein